MDSTMNPALPERLAITRKFTHNMLNPEIRELMLDMKISFDGTILLYPAGSAETCKATFDRIFGTPVDERNSENYVYMITAIEDEIWFINAVICEKFPEVVLGDEVTVGEWIGYNNLKESSFGLSENKDVSLKVLLCQKV